MTTPLRRSALLAIALCLGPAVLRAERKPLQLKWTELQPVVQSHDVAVVLRSGGIVKGEAVAIRDETLVMDIRSVSGTKQYGRGNGTVPRAEIESLGVRRTRGAWGRTLGTTLGVIAGLGLGGYTAVHMDSGGGALAVFTGVTSGVAVLGYYMGRELDQRVTRIVILP